MNTSIGFTKFSDEKLYDSCKKLGQLLLRGRNIFLVMLPEVNRRRLFLKKGFESIFHFAKMTGGVSELHVRRVLNVEARLADLPVIKSLLLSGKVSINKFAKIVSVITPENQEYWAHQIQQLPTRAIETLVRDYQLAVHNEPKQTDSADEKTESQNGLFEANIEQKSVHVNTFESVSIPQITQIARYVKTPELSDEVKEKLNRLQARNIDINEIILEALTRREAEIAAEKANLAEKAEAKLIEQMTEEKSVSRALPSATKRLLKKEFGTKCAVDVCLNNSEEIHHTNRFSISKSHNPYFLAPLCKQHHQIAHSNDVTAAEKRLGKT